MTTVRRRKTAVTVDVEQKRHSGVLYGPVRVVHPAIKSIGCPYQYDNRQHCYSVPLRFLDDVMVAIELAGHRTAIVMAPW